MEIKIADNFKSRLIGLMFKKKIDYGLLINVKGNSKISSSIHSCFMRTAIDVYFIDNENIVFEKIVLKPWRFYMPKKKASYILETPVNSIDLKKEEKVNLDNLIHLKDFQQW